MLHFLKRRRTLPKTTYHDSQWLNQLQNKSTTANCAEVVVDLENVERIDSRELGELVKIHMRLRQCDSRLVLTNAHGSVLEVLEITRINRLIEVREAFDATAEPEPQPA